jgi:Asp-tRNA(Asn)/Glu-tRNA(Gln) amidotransferase A subunit family amidase
MVNTVLERIHKENERINAFISIQSKDQLLSQAQLSDQLVQGDD